MSQKIHIDQYIQEKVNMLSFSYEDTFWQDAEKLIINDEKKRKRRVLFWIFLITSISLLAIFFAVLSSPNANKFNLPENKKSNFNTIKDVIINKDSTQNGIIKSDKKGRLIYNLNKKNKSSSKQENKLVITKKNKAKRNSSEFMTAVSIEEYKNNNIDSITNIEKININRIDVPNIYNLWLTDEENNKKYKRNRVFFGISFGSTFNTKLDPAYFASIHLQKIHNKKWSTRLSTQIVATSFPYLNYKYTKTDYSFGEKITNHEIQSDIVYGLQIPISLHYRFYKFHSAFVGLGYSYYLAQKNIISSEFQGEITFDKEYGVSNEIRKHNASVLLGYETIVWRKYQIGLSGQVPLLNPIISKNNSTNNSFRTLPEIRAYILYNFMKLK